jgi:hypothetical protein
MYIYVNLRIYLNALGLNKIIEIFLGLNFVNNHLKLLIKQVQSRISLFIINLRNFYPDLSDYLKSFIKFLQNESISIN